MGAVCCTNHCRKQEAASNFNIISGQDAKKPKKLPISKSSQPMSNLAQSNDSKTDTNEKVRKKPFPAVPVTSSSNCPPIPLPECAKSTNIGHVHRVLVFNTNQGKTLGRGATGGWRSSGISTARRYASPEPKEFEKERETLNTTVYRSQLTKTRPSPYQ